MNTKNHYIRSFISQEEIYYKYLYQLPPKQGRYIVLDTETTGLEKDDHVIEIGACEIKNGNLTGDQFHIYIRPRIKMKDKTIKIHGIRNEFYDDYYKDLYTNDKQNLLNFSKWVGNSIIFAHNAPFDMNGINRELYYWQLHEIPTTRYRCSMRMFRKIISREEPLYDEKYTSLEKCCEYFGLKTNEKIFHNALFDSYMTARLVCKLFEKIESDPILYKEFGYHKQKFDNYNKTTAFSQNENKTEKKEGNIYINNYNNNSNMNKKELEENKENNNSDNKKENIDITNNKNNNNNINNENNQNELSNDIINELFKEFEDEKTL